MVYLLLFFIELLILFLISRKLLRNFLLFFYKISTSEKITIWIFSLFFAIGTFVHELSHFLFALFLLVPVGKVEFLPDIDGKKIKLGSVGIGKTDPIRKTIVGFAPLIVGVVLIFLLSNFILGNGLSENWLLTLFVGFLIFQISNSMFMSRSDIKGLLELTVIVAVIITTVYIFGVSIDFNINLNSKIAFQETVKLASKFLIIPIAIDLIFNAIFKFFRS